jgi:hypothetical protein
MTIQERIRAEIKRDNIRRLSSLRYSVWMTREGHSEKAVRR